VCGCGGRNEEEEKKSEQQQQQQQQVSFVPYEKKTRRGLLEPL
jgi:hypothetical protein